MRDPVGDFAGDALSGADGTQGPDPLPMFPDALTGPAAPDSDSVPERDRIAPFVLPPAPDAGAIQEAIAAALSDEPAGWHPPPHPPPRPQPAQRRRPLPPPQAPPGQAWQQQPWSAPMPRQDPRMYTAPAAGLQRRPQAGPHRNPAPYAAAPRRRKIGMGCVLVLVFTTLVIFTLLAQAIAGLD